MEKEKLNLVEILKNVPKGTKLYSPLCGECELESVNQGDYPIRVDMGRWGLATFTYDGKIYNSQDAECLLLPSKEQRDWSKFEVKEEKKEVTLHPGDRVLVRDGGNREWLFNFFSHLREGEEYSNICINGMSWRQCIPYNDDTRHLIGTTDPCPIYYEIKFEK